MKNVLMDEWFTANGVGFAGLDAPLWVMILVSGLIAAACLTAAGVLLKKRVRSI